MNSLKKSLAAFIVVTMFVPMLYLGTLAPKEAEAQAGLASCLFGNLISSAIQGAVKFVQGAAAAIGIIQAPSAAAAASGSAEGAGSVDAGSASAGSTNVVPVWDKNPVTAQSLGNTSQATGASALANLASLGLDGLMSLLGMDGTAASMSLLFKECVLDPLAWFIKNVVIKSLAQDIMNWVAGGFEGAPSFMTDKISFMQGIGDAATGLFLWNSGLDEYLCSPFQLDVRIDLMLNHDTQAFSPFGRMACTLDDVFSNVAASGVSVGGGLSVDAAYDRVVNQGDIAFAGAGFTSVFGVMEDQNNAYGTYFNLQSEASYRSNTFRAKENQLLIEARGWLSPRCNVYGPPAGGAAADGVNRTNDSVCTPGEWVAQQITSWTDSSLNQLVAADELAEIIDAVIAGLVTRILNETGALGTGLLNSGSAQNWGGTAPNTIGDAQAALDARLQAAQNVSTQTVTNEQNNVTTPANGDPFAGVGASSTATTTAP